MLQSVTKHFSNTIKTKPNKNLEDRVKLSSVFSAKYETKYTNVMEMIIALKTLQFML